MDCFKAFKRTRDLIKCGVNFSLRGSQWNVGVGCNRNDREGGIVVCADTNGKNFRLGDFSAAFSYFAAMEKYIGGRAAD